MDPASPLRDQNVLRDRFRGCLLGLAVGDALGGRFEGQTAAHIRSRFPTLAALLEYPQDELWYTDDTQMTIGVAETLAAFGEILEERLCAAFVANYMPSRGYGRGARAVLSAMEDGRDYRQVAAEYFPGGSYGNGAAMRVAPIGLLFRDQSARLWEQARLSALPTHVHPLGVEGAQVLAFAVALCCGMERFDRADFFARLRSACTSDVFRDKLELAARVRSLEDLAQLGNGIEAVESVPTAIASFALTPNSYFETIAHAIFLGGDTDTVAAMAGALSGAYLGVRALPERLVRLLEDRVKGRSYLSDLADRLFETYQTRAKAT
jgi:poly(ADP-ribose) glycohydrolase ARH3